MVKKVCMNFCAGGLGLGSYQTAWAWLHKMRTAMVRPGRDRLGGLVEVDESYVGGEKSGKGGRGAEGKALVAVAVEDKGDQGVGRIRMAVVPDASGKSLIGFVRASVVERQWRAATDGVDTADCLQRDTITS